MEIVSAPKVYGFDTGFICYHPRDIEQGCEKMFDQCTVRFVGLTELIALLMTAA